MKRYFTFLFMLHLFLSSAQVKNRAIDSIENLIKNAPDIDTKLTEKAGLALKCLNMGDGDKAMRLFNETYEEALKTGSQKGLGAVYNTQGIFFYYQSMFDSALFYFEKALTIRRKIKDDSGVLKTTGNIGSIYYMMGNHKKALGYYEEALKKESILKFEEGSQVSINNVGKVYENLRMYDRALYYFRKAEKIYSKKDARGDLAFTYEGLSSVYKGLASMNNDSTLLDTALYYIFRSRDVSIARSDKSAEAFALTNISMIYHTQGKFDKAAETYLEALKLARLLKDERLELAVLANLAGNEITQNRTDSALKYIEKFIPLQEKLDYKQNTEGLSKILAEYYYRKKDFKKAYDYIKTYDRYKDSTYNLETTAQINEMQTKFETEKKEKENALLQSENKTYRTTRNYLIIILAIALLGIIGAFIAYKKIKNSKELLSIQKHLVEEKQKEILDSINYAKRIQFALLASDNLLQNHLPDHFVLFKPKDVVSGDFYWAAPVNDGFIFVTADCTGHGVPGAFMSLLNISKLSLVINENKVVRPDHILNNVRSEIIKALNPEGSREVSKDGMDAVVCKLSSDKSKLEFAAANNSFYIIRNKELIVCKADKMPVGKGHDDDASFTYNEISLHKGDIVYTFTDGFADQFGGTFGKKFKYKQFEELLLAIHKESMYMQKQKLNDAFEAWKGDLEQVDDVCVLGVRI